MNKLKLLIFLAIGSITLVSLFLPSKVNAFISTNNDQQLAQLTQEDKEQDKKEQDKKEDDKNTDDTSQPSDPFFNDDSTSNLKGDCKDVNLNEENCGIVGYISDFINILSVLVGIVVTIMIIVGGIQYTAAGGDPNTVAKAKKQIFNAIFALIIYGLTYAFLQYVIPGGLI